MRREDILTLGSQLYYDGEVFLNEGKFRIVLFSVEPLHLTLFEFPNEYRLAEVAQEIQISTMPDIEPSLKTTTIRDETSGWATLILSGVISVILDLHSRGSEDILYD